MRLKSDFGVMLALEILIYALVNCGFLSLASLEIPILSAFSDGRNRKKNKNT